MAMACPKGFFDYDPASISLTDKSDHRYGASLFAIYLAEEHGPEIIRKSWENMTDANQNAIMAIDMALGGSGNLDKIKGEFSNFAVKNYLPYREFKPDLYDDEKSGDKYPNVKGIKSWNYEDINTKSNTRTESISNEWASDYVVVKPLSYGIRPFGSCLLATCPSKLNFSLTGSNLAGAKVLGIKD
jgi:hypothetical protein